MISARGVGTRAAGEDMAAEPVPVRRPGVRLRGVEVWAEANSTGFATGIRKMGLKLCYLSESKI